MSIIQKNETSECPAGVKRFKVQVACSDYEIMISKVQKAKPHGWYISAKALWLELNAAI